MLKTEEGLTRRGQGIKSTTEEGAEVRIEEGRSQDRDMGPMPDGFVGMKITGSVTVLSETVRNRADHQHLQMSP